MIGQARLQELQSATTALQKLTGGLDPRELVDMGARLRAACKALKALSDQIDDKVRSGINGDVLTGVSFKATIVVSERTGMDVKGIRTKLPQKVWAPFVTSTTVESLLYSPN